MDYSAAVVELFGFAVVGSFGFAFFSDWIARRFQILDMPRGGRKIHSGAIPRAGGIGLGLVILFWVPALLGMVTLGIIQSDQRIGVMHALGFCLGIIILMIGGTLDDKFDLPPHIQFIFPMLAATSVVLSGTGISEITNWSGGAPIQLGWFGVPLTFAWVLVVIYAIKFFDGLNGLVSGQVVIGALLIALLSLTTPYFQPFVAFLAVIIGGAYFGFLPHNFPRARQFLGESGSLVAGFSLAFLSIVGGAKIATGLMALGFPLMDAMMVILGRVGRGASPFKGDDTHLHFRLMKAGLSQTKVVLLIWTLSAVTGAVAIGLQSVGKVALIIWIVFAVLVLSAWASWKRKQTPPFFKNDDRRFPDIINTLSKTEEALFRRPLILKIVYLVAVASIAFPLVFGMFFFTDLYTRYVLREQGFQAAIGSMVKVRKIEKLEEQVILIYGRRFTVEVADTRAATRQGLSDRESMERDRGMLFELDYRDIHPFWMNRMHFPLDIIWIDGYTVVEIVENLPAPSFGQIPVTYRPSIEADKVLELNAGIVEETGLKLGDTIDGIAVY